MADRNDQGPDRPGGVAEISLTEVRPGSGEPIDLDFDLKPTFPPGVTIAGRYEVECFLARGGMGEVYRVRDRELGETVALKTILPKGLNDPTTLDRFRREIQTARRVSHPNVCRIFDLGRHMVENGDEVIFLTMELLEGVSLRARLTEGAMRSDEALEVIKQLCDGLAAAHGRGIIHRDLKPSNVFLVPEDGADRVVIADFGLARSVASDEEELTVTRTGELLGTPAYMAPEQMEGLEATAASDIYALGMVIYEILTGARPFEGSTAFQLALNKMRETPSGPSELVGGVPPRWDDVVLRCLESQPDDRFERVEDVIDALTGEAAVGRPLPVVDWRKIGFICAALMLVAAVVLIGLKLTGRVEEKRRVVEEKEAPPPVAVVEDLRSVMVVLGFENLTGNPAAEGISDELRDLLAQRLGTGDELRLIAGEEVVAARTELDIERVTTVGPESLAALRDRLDADFVVLGSYAVFTGEGVVRLDARIQDIEAGEILIVPTVNGPVTDLPSVADAAAAAIRLILGFNDPGIDQVD